MNPDNEIIEVEEPEVIVEPEIIEPKKPKKAKVETIIEDVIVPVLFTKKVNCNGKSYKIHDIAEIPKSELDKLPEKSYLVRKIRK